MFEHVHVYITSTNKYKNNQFHNKPRPAALILSEKKQNTTNTFIDFSFTIKNVEH